MGGVSELTPERLAELRRMSQIVCSTHQAQRLRRCLAEALEHIDAQADEIKRLRRERDEAAINADVLRRSVGECHLMIKRIMRERETLAGALEELVSAARGVPHNGDNFVMGSLEAAIEEAESALRAPGGGKR